MYTIPRHPVPRVEVNPPQGNPDELDDPGDETDILGDVHSIGEYTKRVGNERVVEANTPNRGILSGGPGGDQGAMGRRWDALSAIGAAQMM